MCRTRSFHPFIAVYIWIISIGLMLPNMPTTVFLFAGIIFPGLIQTAKTFGKTTEQIYMYFSISRSILLVEFVLNSSLWIVRWLFCWPWHSMNSQFYRFNSNAWWNEKKRTRIVYNFKRIITAHVYVRQRWQKYRWNGTHR